MLARFDLNDHARRSCEAAHDCANKAGIDLTIYERVREQESTLELFLRKWGSISSLRGLRDCIVRELVMRGML